MQSYRNPDAMLASNHANLTHTPYKFLPDTFSLDDIQPHISADKALSIKKLHALWKAGMPVYLYGSFVTQCGMLLADKKPTHANDIDAASLSVPGENIDNMMALLDKHGFKKKVFEALPYYFIPTCYSFECKDENAKIDFMVKLPNYIDTPNSILISSFTLHFVDKDPLKIHFQFDERKTQLEYYCNHSICEVTPPQLQERGVIRRILKQINNNRDLYNDKTLHFYFNNQKVETFSADDKAWKKLTDHMKHIFKKKVGSRKFLSYYNELRRMINDGTFFIPEAQLFIENFFSVLLAHQNKRNYQHLQYRAENMAKILQKFFAAHPEQSDNIYDIVNRLLNYHIYLDSHDPRIIDSIATRLNSTDQSGYQGGYTPRLFLPKAAPPLATTPTEPKSLPSQKI